PGRPNRPGWGGGPNRPGPDHRPGPGWRPGPGHRPGPGPYRPRPGWNGHPWRPGHYPHRPWPHRGRDWYRPWYGFSQTNIIIGNTTILPAAWGWTGGAAWYGIGGYGYAPGAPTVVIDAPQIIAILVEVNQSEIALAQSVLDRIDPCSYDFAQSVLDAHVNLASQ